LIHHPEMAPLVGLTMLSPRQILERDGVLTGTIPETVRKSVRDLAPAFAVA